jgi:16S rRNA (guanine966-N2)-methyltransferase
VVRIIAGSVGRRVIRAPAGRGTRPTSDRVRESLFGTLGRLVEVSAGPFVDLYAGSGAVGLEAVSRGAPGATFVERDAAAAAVIRGNVRSLGLEGRCRVEVADVGVYLGRAAGVGAGVVFLDPPYQASVDADLAAVVAGGWLAPGGLCVVERGVRSAPPAWPPGLAVEAARTYGDTVLLYARYR